MMPRLRNWCALCQYPGKASFYLGTVQAEADESAFRAAEELAGKLFPTPPTIISVVPGMVVLVPEDKA